MTWALVGIIYLALVAFLVRWHHVARGPRDAFTAYHEHVEACPVCREDRRTCFVARSLASKAVRVAVDKHLARTHTKRSTP